MERNLHSPENRIQLDKLLDLNALPSKGKLSVAQREWETEDQFWVARQQRPAVAAAINHPLGQHGLDCLRSLAA